MMYSVQLGYRGLMNVTQEPGPLIFDSRHHILPPKRSFLSNASVYNSEPNVKWALCISLHSDACTFMFVCNESR